MTCTDYSHTGWCFCGRPNIYCDGHGDTMATKRRLHITKANAQNGGRAFLWPEYRKIATIRARYIGGAFTVETREGVLDMPDGGYLALDDEGYPYPVQKDVFERIYQEVRDAA